MATNIFSRGIPGIDNFLFSKFSGAFRAIMLHEFGGPEVLRYEETLLPELKPGEVLVCVHAIGINPPDWYLRDGYNVLPHRLRKYCEQRGLS